MASTASSRKAIDLLQRPQQMAGTASTSSSRCPRPPLLLAKSPTRFQCFRALKLWAGLMNRRSAAARDLFSSRTRRLQIVGFGRKLRAGFPPILQNPRTPPSLGWVGFVNLQIPDQVLLHICGEQARSPATAGAHSCAARWLRKCSAGWSRDFRRPVADGSQLDSKRTTSARSVRPKLRRNPSIPVGAATMGRPAVSALRIFQCRKTPA